ncbi:MAG TPA: helix-turn-helix domain-containing protein [Candidatus Desulfaltia sp.]|nr:helix-turn-helix domain-containing protein [Candidatus Desulfaltia sp.]
MDRREKAIKELMRFKKRAGWSQDRLAKELGVHNQTVGGWLRGLYKPSLLALPLIEAFLKKARRTK